jgi:hypothetical protein
MAFPEIAAIVVHSPTSHFYGTHKLQYIIDRVAKIINEAQSAQIMPESHENCAN